MGGFDYESFVYNEVGYRMKVCGDLKEENGRWKPYFYIIEEFTPVFSEIGGAYTMTSVKPPANRSFRDKGEAKSFMMGVVDRMTLMILEGAVDAILEGCKDG